VTLSGPTEVNPTFKIPDGGQEGASLGFQLTVTDNGGLEGTDRCNVNVTSTKPPVPYIKANGQDSPITLSTGTSLEISVHLDPGDYAGQLADWWVVVHIPSDPPFDWAHYKWLGERKQARRLGRWKNGVELSRQAPLYNISQQVLRTKWLPPGDYIFYFAVDNNADGKPDATWLDYVEVTIQ
jgi:hypothetical protein